MRITRSAWWWGLLLLIFSQSVLAVARGWTPPPAQDPEETAFSVGYRAFEQGDWQVVIDNMQQALEQRPWDDEAHNLMGYAYRRLGDYPRALRHYDAALELNPYNRGAMEYLGEVFLKLDCPHRAIELLQRLAAECRRLGEDWQRNCGEWRDLRAAIDAYQPSTQTDDDVHPPCEQPTTDNQ